jgi:hypothetical protein
LTKPTATQAHAGQAAFESQTTLRKWLPISTPDQTLLDLAGIGIGLAHRVIIADGMIKTGHTSPDRLVKAAREWSGRGC